MAEGPLIIITSTPFDVSLVISFSLSADLANYDTNDTVFLLHSRITFSRSIGIVTLAVQLFMVGPRIHFSFAERDA